MRPRRNLKRKVPFGWKTYAVAALSIVLGGVAFACGYIADGLKGIVFGFALIALRDAISKILHDIESSRHALSDLRASVETALEQVRPRR
jgi:hypothetical protein